MQCVKPYVHFASHVPFGCTQCLPCRINRRRQWAFRMLLENFKHGDSSFITLTYANDTQTSPCKVCRGPCKKCKCKTHGDSVSPLEARNFLKRLRKILEPEKIRYFLVGEYGSQTQRPHYHAIVFGLNQFVAGGRDGFSGVVRDAWSCGHVFVGDANIDSMQYVAGYVTKKLTSAGDERLNGRHPEFARMSLRPGIGAPAVGDIARAVDTPVGLRQLIESGDVPFTLLNGSRSLPLHRYIRTKLRVALGMDEKSPEKAQRLYSLQLMDVFNKAKSNVKLMAGCISASDLWSRINSSRALTLEKRFRIFESAHSL